MRIGRNPNSNKNIDLSVKCHRVIIPVYIPHFEGYFMDSLNVFRVCMESLLLTINEDTAISIISNGSAIEVNEYIYQLWQEKKIDRAVFNDENVGKMNAIISETRASFEEFITYSDADVFFDKGWLGQTFEMFHNIPKAGFVSMNPTPKNYGHSNSTLINNMFTVLFKKKLRTNVICSYMDLEHFHRSIGKDKSHTDKMYNGVVFSVSNYNYIIGAGHFCCTIRKTPTLKYVPLEKSTIAASGGSESHYLDIPFDKTGLWRLSSPKAFVWHMGNVLDKEWTNQKLTELKDYKESDFTFQEIPFRDASISSILFPYFLKTKMVSILRKFKFL